MLQASEYHVHDFLAWHRRVSDFRQVEKRKSIQWTAKARFFFALGWAVSVCFIAASITVLLWVPLQYGIILALALMLANAYALPYALAGVASLVYRVQMLDERYVLRNVAKKLRAHRALKIGVAGSFGKTSMREILKTVLAEGKKVAAPEGSFNTPLGIQSFVDTLDGDEEILIFELGEYYPGDVKKLCEAIAPDIGFITGVNEAHLEKFGSLTSTTATIFELADYMQGKPVYVNAENERARHGAREGHILYSREGVDGWRVEDAATTLEGTSCTLVSGSIRIPVHSKLLGLHVVGPLGAAGHLAYTLGFSVAAIESGLAKTRPFPHRLEPRTDRSGVTTLDDSYNGNPDGVAAIIEFLKNLKHRRTYVTPGLVEAGESVERVHRAIGKQLAGAGIERVVLIRNSVTPFIAAGLKDAKYTGEVIWYDDALKAYAALPLMTVQGDIVVLQNDWPDQYA